MNRTAQLLAKRVFLLLPCLICLFSLLPVAASAGSIAYQYDAWHRLTGATYNGGVVISYTYDTAGNRLKKVVASPSGDINGNMVLGLEDGILALQIVAGYPVTDISLAADVNGDGKIGITEAIFVLQVLGGLQL
jgi:YD repeat-containing protein